MKKVIVIFLLFSFYYSNAQQLIINEIVADNTSGYTDANGKTPDWIEIKNISTSPVLLSNYYLADKNNIANPWQLPNVTLNAGAYYLVKATAPENVVVQWETYIDKGQNWKYIVPTSEPSSIWKIVGFDDASWSEGPSGIGFDDGDDATIISANISSFYMRKKFTIVDKSIISDAILHMNYDDGFVAYINGVEVARAQITVLNPLYSDFATGHDAGVYEVFNIENIQDIIQNGENVLSIQVHNVSLGSSDMSSIPILSFGYTQSKSPTNGVSPFISLSAESTDANFKINASNETIYLFQNTQIIDSIEINDLPTDVSIGRINNDKNTLRYFTLTTPNANNASVNYIAETLEKPSISVQGGVKRTAFYLKMHTNVFGGKIYYTTNGDEPNATSTLYSDSIRVSVSRNFKAKVFKTGYLPSEEKTESYIFYTRPQVIPIVSITVKNEDFFDWNTGIYVEGPNAEPGEPHFGANFWQDWERPSYVEVFNPDGTTAFSQKLGVKIQGNWSRAQPQKSLKFYARSQYGESSIKYQIFKDKPIYEFQSFILRNSGNDFCNTHMRDGMIHSLCRNLNVDYMAYQPAIVYLNGQYYGIQNFREKINKDYIAGNYGLELGTFSIINNIGEVVYGSASNFQNLYSFIENNDISQTANYNIVKQDLDVGNYAKYNVIEMFAVNEDWPGNNVKLWREDNSDGRWRYILYDLDFGFGIWDPDKINHNMLDFALTDDPYIGWPNPQWSTLVLRKLTQNTEFNNLFMNYTADILNTTFHPDSIIHHIDSLAAKIVNELSFHANKWEQSSVEDMLGNIQGMRDFANARGDVMRTHFENHYNTNGSYTITVNNSIPNAGKVHLNSIDITRLPWSGKYFKNIPITLTAIPAPGYEFVRWEGGISSTNPSIVITTTSNISVNAVYNSLPAIIPQVYITEVNYNSDSTSQSGDWIELYNAKASSQDISGWIIKNQQLYNSFQLPPNTIIPPQSFIVVCKDTSLFKTIYPATILKVGNMPFSISKNLDNIKLYNQNTFLIDEFAYSDNLPWPKKCDGNGFTLQFTNINGDRNDPLIWRAADLLGSPGENNNMIILTPNRNKIIINEINFNSYSVFNSGDWIELYNSSTVPISISEWVLRDISNNIFVIPAGTTIPSNSYLVFAKDAERFSTVYPDVDFIDMNLSLGSTLESIALYDQYEFLIDSTQYSIFNLLALGANGTGKTLSLTSPLLPNHNLTNWALSVYGGTPGRSNEISIGLEEPSIPNLPILYPNPCYNEIIVTVEMPYNIEIYNMQGMLVLKKENSFSSNLNCINLQSGTYVVKVSNSNSSKSTLIQKK